MKRNDFDYKIKKTPVLLKPYFFIKPSYSAVSIRILIMLLIQMLLLLFTKSYSALIVILSSVAGGLCAYGLNYINKRFQLFTLIPLITQGIFIGMLLPQTFPPLVVFLLSFLVLSIERIIFDNKAQSWVNIICVTVILASFIGSTYFPGFQVTRDILSIKNPSVLLIKSGAFPVYDFDAPICNILNSTVLYWFKVTLPEGVISLLWDSQSIIPAFRFTFLTLISSIFLFADNGYSLTIPTIFVVVFGLLVRFLLPVMVHGPLAQGDLLLAFCTSGTVFFAVFIIQWCGTCPVTKIGKVIYGFASGVIAFFIMGCGTSSVGMCYAVLICNVLNLLIRVIEEKQDEIKVNKLVSSIVQSK